MKPSFRIVGLPAAQFETLYSLNEEQLAAKGARRLRVDSKPGFPCRISLADAELGETVILLPFVHHDVDSPYRASGPIFIRQDASEAELAPGEVPGVVSRRVMSVRAYDRNGMMVNGNVVAGQDLKAELEALLANSNVSYVHLHNAGAGCYSCRVERVD